MMRDEARQDAGQETTAPAFYRTSQRRTDPPNRSPPLPAAVRGDAVIRDSSGRASFCDDIELGSLSAKKSTQRTKSQFGQLGRPRQLGKLSGGSQ